MGDEGETHIQLNQPAIDQVLGQESVPGLLETYGRLQAELRSRDVSRDPEYQTRYNGFYRLRRNAEWRKTFYTILERDKSKLPSFADVLRELHKETGRVEASFASKLVATIDPSKPVIDSIVLENLGYRLPSRRETISHRMEGIVDLHGRLVRRFSEYLTTETGRYLVRRFQESYPKVQLTEMKMLDLVLWRTRMAA
jgi:hypothetical protein